MKNNIKPNKPFLLQIALIPVCKIVIRFGLHFNEFVRNLQKAYIFAAEEILKESNIDNTLQAIAIKTGMDRRTISEHKNNTLHSNPMNKMDMLIVQLIQTSQVQDNKNFSKEKLKRIIDSIYAKHIRSNAIIKELVTNNIIEQNNKGFRLNLSLQNHLSEIRFMAEEVDITAKRLFETYYKNMFMNQKETDKQLIQLTQFSTKIPTRHQKHVNELLKKELLVSENNLKKILLKYESKLPENTYQELGITLFQFNSKN